MREIVFAVAMGGLAAGGAALVLEGMDSDGTQEVRTIEASGPSNAEYAVTQFEGVSTVGPQDVVISYGEELSVRSEGSPQALALLEAVVENGRLVIRPKSGFNWSRWNRLSSATFYLTMPRLDGVTVAGSGDVKIDKVEGGSFEATVGGPGTISIADLRVERAVFTVAGAGDLVAAGFAADTNVTIAGAGEIKAAGLRSETASISIGGSGDVALTVDDQARVSITGSGDVDISGPGQCSVTRMGSGDVRCAGGGGTSD